MPVIEKTSMSDSELSQRAKKAFQVFDICSELLDLLSKGTLNRIIDGSTAEIISNFEQQLTRYHQLGDPMKSFDDEDRLVGLTKTANELYQLLLSQKRVAKYSLKPIYEVRVVLRRLLYALDPRLIPVNDELTKLNEQMLDMESSIQNGVSENLNKVLNDVNNQILALESRLDESELKSLVADAKSKTDELDRYLKSISEKEDEVKKESAVAIKKIRKHGSNTVSEVVAQDYKSRAGTESKIAEGLRIGSFVLMALAAYILATTVFKLPFFEANSIADASAEVHAGLKIMLSILISVPAAYLARESTKHRIKQNAYEQIAMNIDAVHMLVAPLKEEDQSEVIAAMANRLFANPVGVGQNGHAADSFPINSGELLMKMMDKMDFKKTAQGSGTEAAPKP